MASDFQYLTTAEYISRNLAISGVADTAAMEGHISYAERLIDAHCGAWPRYYSQPTGEVEAVSGASITSSAFSTGYVANYWAVGGLYLYVYEGGGQGAERLITSSSDNTAGLLTAVSGMDTTSKFILRQHSVFPRYLDVDGSSTPYIPRRIKDAVASQVAFGFQKGDDSDGLWHDDAVLNDRGDLVSESYGSGYSYSRDARRVEGAMQFLAPQVALHLRGYIWRVGKMLRRGSRAVWVPEL
jgi:hypothetical protein